MAQVNIILSEEEVLQVLTGNRDDALKFLLTRVINEIMKAESEEQLGASKHERTEGRTDYRNGYRERELTTRIGTITLQVPRHRNVPFHTMIFEQYKRSEASLIATMVQMVIAGVSTRKVEKVVETLCGTGFSKSTVSRLCQVLDKEIEAFRARPLDYVDAPFLMVDATYFKAREEHRIKSKAFLTVLGIRSDGMREVLDFAVYDNEDNYSWRAFFERLKMRGLKEPKLVISDAHKSIRQAIAKVYPGAAWQRCQVHLRRNIMDVTPNKYKEGLKGLPVSMNPYDEANSEPNFWLSCLIVDKDAMCRQVRNDREALYIPESKKSCPTEILEAISTVNADHIVLHRDQVSSAQASRVAIRRESQGFKEKTSCYSWSLF